MDKRLKHLIATVRRQTKLARHLLVPLSGGTDSALTWHICNQAAPGRVIGVHIGSQLCGQDWLAAQGGTIDVVREIPGFEDKEAMRWAYLSGRARKEDAWLVSTRNWSEDRLGTYSLVSRIATYLPIVGVPKSVVMELCDIIAVPPDVLAGSRRADPDCGRPQELADVPLELIDEFLFKKEGLLPRGYSYALTSAQNKYLNGIYRYTRFKEHIPIRGADLLPR
jgi:NH3-dependent NAD+ synthetase